MGPDSTTPPETPGSTPAEATKPIETPENLAMIRQQAEAVQAAAKALNISVDDLLNKVAVAETAAMVQNPDPTGEKKLAAQQAAATASITPGAGAPERSVTPASPPAPEAPSAGTVIPEEAPAVPPAMTFGGTIAPAEAAPTTSPEPAPAGSVPTPTTT